MLRWLARPAERCLGRVGCGCGSGGSGGGSGDGLLWHAELKPHASGEYSIAVAQANERLEDQGQVVTSPVATFVGVYDGHGGPEASRFLSSRLFPHLHSECAAGIICIELLIRHHLVVYTFFLLNMFSNKLNPHIRIA